MKVQVIDGDISKTPADALITAINSGGMWFGGIDRVIQDAAGMQYHNIARSNMPLKHGQVVIAPMSQMHRGDFLNVVFVVDDLQSPLSEVVWAGLLGAARGGFTQVTMPAIRMGVMRGVVERSLSEAAQELATGISLFSERGGAGLETITIVTFRDAEVLRLISSAISF